MRSAINAARRAYPPRVVSSLSVNGVSSAAGPMPMKAECRSLVCRIVKVFFPFAAATKAPGKSNVTPTAAEAARNSRRESVSRDRWLKVNCQSAASLDS